MLCFVLEQPSQKLCAWSFSTPQNIHFIPVASSVPNSVYISLSFCFLFLFFFAVIAVVVVFYVFVCFFLYPLLLEGRGY